MMRQIFLAATLLLGLAGCDSAYEDACIKACATACKNTGDKMRGWSRHGGCICGDQLPDAGQDGGQ